MGKSRLVADFLSPPQLPDLRTVPLDAFTESVSLRGQVRRDSKDLLEKSRLKQEAEWTAERLVNRGLPWRGEFERISDLWDRLSGGSTMLECLTTVQIEGKYWSPRLERVENVGFFVCRQWKLQLA